MSKRSQSRSARSVSKADPVVAETPDPVADTKARQFSVLALANLIGRNRQTVQAWIDDKDLPCTKLGPGMPTLIDMAEFFEWREKFVREDERSKFKPSAGEADEDGAPLSYADMAKIADIRTKNLALAIKAKILLHREPMEMAVRQANGIARQTIMSLPEQIARKANGFPRAVVDEFREMAWDVCASAMTLWANEVAAAMKAEADRVVDFSEDEADEA